MMAPNTLLLGLRAGLLTALGLSACTSRPIDDVGAGDPATTDQPATSTGAPTTGDAGTTTTTAGTTHAGEGTTGTGSTGATSTGAGSDTTVAVSSTGEVEGTTTTLSTTTGVDISTSTSEGTSTTGTPDLPCTPVAEVGTDLMSTDVIDFPGCEEAAPTDCYDYMKVCAPRPDGVASCEECAPDCIGALPMLCDAFFRDSMVCGPWAEGEQCCQIYSYGWNCTDGRPFQVEGETRVATPIRDAAWAGREAPTLLAELTPSQRAGLAKLWAAEALAEHASVAAFARFSLQLLALGAPPELVADACRAQLDEVGHARTTFALAAAYGSPIGPGPLAIAGAMDGAEDLEGVLVATFVEGCVGETIAAAELELAAQGCADPVVAACLRGLAADEQRHAALAWRTVQWLLQVGGPALRGALVQASTQLRVPVAGTDELPAALLRRHGRLPAGERAALVNQCLRAVIRPCVQALLGDEEFGATARA